MEALELLRQGGRKKVGLDMDGTLADSYQAILNEYNAHNGTNFEIGAFSSYSNWSMPLTFPEYERRHHDIWTHRWKTIKPSISPASMNLLVAAHSVDIVTCQRAGYGYEECMQRWLGEFFPGANLTIRITRTANEKAHLGYDVLIDDAPPLAEELIRNGRLKAVLIMVDRPWNARENYEKHRGRIVRAKSLDHGVNLLANGAMLRSDQPAKVRHRYKAR
jgi:5'(3')-deoxyribonucleotidase